MPKNITSEKLFEAMSLYERTLLIPKNKPQKQFVICTVGLVGSGKTTVMKPLSKALGLIRIAGDEIRKVLFENGFSQNLLMDISVQVNRKYLSLGYSMACDSDCVSELVRNDINRIGKEFNAKIFFLHINPPEEFILKKLSAIKKPWPWLLANTESWSLVEEYYNRKKLHKDLNIPFLQEIDTSSVDLDKQLKNIADCIKKEMETQ